MVEWCYYQGPLFSENKNCVLFFCMLMFAVMLGFSMKRLGSLKLFLENYLKVKTDLFSNLVKSNLVVSNCELLENLFVWEKSPSTLGFVNICHVAVCKASFRMVIN